MDALGLIRFAEARAALREVLVHVVLARRLVGAVGALELGLPSAAAKLLQESWRAVWRLRGFRERCAIRRQLPGRGAGWVGLVFFTVFKRLPNLIPTSKNQNTMI